MLHCSSRLIGVGPNRRQVGDVVHRAERRNELSGEDREVTRAWPHLFDDQRSTRQSRVGPDRCFRREHRTVEELVPDRQREAEVDILGSVQLVVDAVKVRD